MNLEDYRLKIDELDAEIVELLCERFDLVKEIGEYKKEHGIDVLDSAREKDKLRKLNTSLSAKNAEYYPELENVLYKIMDESKIIQKKLSDSKLIASDYGLLGRKLSHSLSPMLHRLFGGEDFDYALIEKEEIELERFFAEKKFKGINVTIPYKKTVMEYCDEISDLAKEIGSVNAIVKTEGEKLVGYNTDYEGFVYMLKRSGISVSGKKALVLGSGGASNTVVKALADEGVRELVTISRSGDNNYCNLDRHRDCELIVNTTPVGMYPFSKVKPVDEAAFPNLEICVDLIYNPQKTELVKACEKNGIKAIGGLSMLVAQGAAAHELFSGRKIDEREIEKAIEYIEALWRE